MPANQRNEDFSSSPETSKKFGTTEFEKSVQDGTINGQNNIFNQALKLVPGGFFDTNPTIAPEVKELAEKATRASKFLDSARDAEGLIVVNGFRLPGIFKGLSISGGIFTEKFDQQRHRPNLKGLNKGETAKLHQIDKGIRPYSGRANYHLMDDLYSNAFQKMQEFHSMITNWEQGPDIATQFIRVFEMKTFLSGVRGPLPFSLVKITNFRFELPTDSFDGIILAEFNFEQFEIIKVKEDRLQNVATANKGDGVPPETPVTASPVNDPITVPTP